MGLFSEMRNANYVSQTQLGEPRNQLARALWLTDNFRRPKTNHLIAKRLQDGIAGIILGPGKGRFLPGGTLVVRSVDIGGAENAAYSAYTRPAGSRPVACHSRAPAKPTPKTGSKRPLER